MKGLRFSLCLTFLLLSGFVAAEPLYPFETPEQTAQFHHVLRELRCLVCQNQDLADSSASLANDLRLVVYEQVKAGHSNEDIIRDLTARYGDFIVFNPPVKSTTWVLWFGPILFLLMGVFMFWVSTRHD